VSGSASSMSTGASFPASIRRCVGFRPDESIAASPLSTRSSSSPRSSSSRSGSYTSTRSCLSIPAPLNDEGALEGALVGFGLDAR